jgi:hypothetical protein
MEESTYERISCKHDMSEEELGKKKIQIFRVDISEVNFTYVVISLTNWSRLLSCIIQY